MRPGSSHDANAPAWAQDPDADTSAYSEAASLVGNGGGGGGDASSSNSSWVREEGRGDGIFAGCCVCYDPILCPFWILHGLAALVGLCTVVVNTMLLADMSDGVMPVVCRLYAVLFGLLIVFVEIDCRYVLEYFKALEFWAFRGLFYIFVGVETVKSDDVAQGIRAEALCGGVLGVLGVIYFVMGICCIQNIKLSRLSRLQRRGVEGYQAVDDAGADPATAGAMGASGGNDTCGVFKLCSMC
jgi:hypothetical protein